MRYEVHVFSGLGGRVFAKGTMQLEEFIENLDPDWESYHWGHGQWKQCLKEIIARRTKNRDAPKIILIGHSYGALRCQQLAVELDKIGLWVDYIGCIDATALGFWSSVMNIPDNVKFVDEFWASSGFPYNARKKGVRRKKIGYYGGQYVYPHKTPHKIFEYDKGHVPIASDKRVVDRIMAQVKERVKAAKLADKPQIVKEAPKTPEKSKSSLTARKISSRQLQRLLAKANYYKGAIDGDEGDKTKAAVEAILKRNVSKVSVKLPSYSRKRIAAAQLVLNAMDYEAGIVDGYAGHNTMEALSSWEEFEAKGKKPVLARKPAAKYNPPKSIPLQRDVRRVYGVPGKGSSGTIHKQLVRAKFPYPMRLAWAKSKTVRSTMVHKKVARSLEQALQEVLDHYGLAEIKRLGLDLFGGAYNPRRMRRGKKWSMHAYGIAIDIDPERNGLSWSCPRAQFCKPEYKPFLDIMEKHGWLPALRLWGKDAMHFQVARLK